MTLVFLLLFVLGAIGRFVPHPANFAPIAALGIFAGLYGNKKQAIALPLAARLISDVLIGFFNPMIMISVYVATLIGSLLGVWAKGRKSVIPIYTATLVGSIVFFVLTNGVGWIFGDLYPKTGAGLLESYTMALPFFRNTVLGDLFYVTLLVGSYETALAINQKLKQRRLLWQQQN